MQVKSQNYSRINREVVRMINDLVLRHPTMKIGEIMDKYNLIRVVEEDKHTNPDEILARSHVKLTQEFEEQFA